MAINAAGQVVGGFTIDGVTHAFFYSSDTGMKDLGSFGGTSYGWCINAGGQAVGASATAAGAIHPFLYTEKKGSGPIGRNGPPGAAHQLDLTPFSPGMKGLGDFGGSNDTRAIAINDSGQVVGYYTTAAGAKRASSTAAPPE